MLILHYILAMLQITSPTMKKVNYIYTEVQTRLAPNRSRTPSFNNSPVYSKIRVNSSASESSELHTSPEVTIVPARQSVSPTSPCIAVHLSPDRGTASPSHSPSPPRSLSQTKVSLCVCLCVCVSIVTHMR